MPPQRDNKIPFPVKRAEDIRAVRAQPASCLGVFAAGQKYPKSIECGQWFWYENLFNISLLRTLKSLLKITVPMFFCTQFSFNSSIFPLPRYKFGVASGVNR